MGYSWGHIYVFMVLLRLRVKEKNENVLWGHPVCSNFKYCLVYGGVTVHGGTRPGLCSKKHKSSSTPPLHHTHTHIPGVTPTEPNALSALIGVQTVCML